MTRAWRITKADSADLGFAWASLLAGALSLEEFKMWAEQVVTEMDSDTLPPHMIEIMMLETQRDATVGLKDVLGFWPTDALLEDRNHKTALTGIAALRGNFRSEDASISLQAAIAKVQQNKVVRDRFESLFPFISLPEEHNA